MGAPERFFTQAAANPSKLGLALGAFSIFYPLMTVVARAGLALARMLADYWVRDARAATERAPCFSCVTFRRTSARRAC